MSFVAIPRERWIREIDEILETMNWNRERAIDQTAISEVSCDKCGTLIRDPMIWLNEGRIHCVRCRKDPQYQ